LSRSTSPLPAAAEAVLTFLESVGRRSEAELYLRLFRQLPKESFAVILADALVVRQAVGSLVEQLRFLADLGLFAPVVLGLFDPASAAAGAERLASRLPAAGLSHQMFGADAPDCAEQARAALRAEKFPLIRFAPASGQGVRGRFQRVAELVRSLESRKLVILRRRGGLGPHADRRIDLPGGAVMTARSGGLNVINLRTDTQLLLGSRLLRKDDAELLEEVRALLLAPDAARILVSVTSPLNLLRELFTVRGAGTLIKAGTAIDRYAGYAEVDLPRLRQLFEASFGRRLKDGFFERDTLALFVEADYRAAAVLQPSSVAPFLTKFAVEPIAQGEGMARDLWQAATHEFPSVFWRTSADNPITSWYVTLCDGMLRLRRWHVFWRGIEPAEIPTAVHEALTQPEDFERAAR
jgi:bifunctional N-acetylglutamate synthase/kinase